MKINFKEWKWHQYFAKTIQNFNLKNATGPLEIILFKASTTVQNIHHCHLHFSSFTFSLFPFSLHFSFCSKLRQKCKTLCSPPAREPRKGFPVQIFGPTRWVKFCLRGGRSEVLPQTVFCCPYTKWELALEQRIGMWIRAHFISCNTWTLLGSWWGSASPSWAPMGTEITRSVCAEVFQTFPNSCRAFPPLSPHWSLWPALQRSFPTSPCSESLFTECWGAFFRSIRPFYFERGDPGRRRAPRHSSPFLTKVYCFLGSSVPLAENHCN